MKFVFFTKGDRQIPSSRVRAYGVSEMLHASGFETEVIPVTTYSIRAFFSYLTLLFSLKREDVVVLQRTVYNKFFFAAVMIARACGRRFVFDIDDAVYEHSPFKTVMLTRLASVVLCGSEGVRVWASRHNAHAHALFNGIPLSVFTVRSPESDASPTIGWIGDGPAHFENLQMLPPIFSAVRAKGVQFKVLIIGARHDARIHAMFRGFAAEIIDWIEPQEAARQIQRFSVGIMPLTDTSWNQGKYLKALECMACGVPVVVSPRSALKEILTPMGYRFWAETADEWVAQLSHLLIDPALRRSEGQKARRIIEERYSMDAMVRDFLLYVRVDT